MEDLSAYRRQVANTAGNCSNTRYAHVKPIKPFALSQILAKFILVAGRGQNSRRAALAA
jgi:hypothetical protein